MAITSYTSAVMKKLFTFFSFLIYRTQRLFFFFLGKEYFLANEYFELWFSTKRAKSFLKKKSSLQLLPQETSGSGGGVGEGAGNTRIKA